eukprot:1401892-Alexandrium_andersonii.AAC.1
MPCVRFCLEGDLLLVGVPFDGVVEAEGFSSAFDAKLHTLLSLSSSALMTLAKPAGFAVRLTKGTA